MQANGGSENSVTPNTPDCIKNQINHTDSSEKEISCAISDGSNLPQNNHFPVGSEENDLYILRKIDNHRKIDYQNIDETIRDSAVTKLIKIAVTLGLSDEPIGRAIKIFDFNLNQAPELKEQLDLLTATSLLMAAKLEDFKCSDLCQKVRANFNGFEESDILHFELEAFRNLNYDAIFSTAPQFLWFQLKNLCIDEDTQFELISHYSRVICICALSSLKCCKYGCEKIASESIKIARDMIQNKKSIDELIDTEENELQLHTVHAMKKLNELIPSGIFNGLIQEETEEEA